MSPGPGVFCEQRTAHSQNDLAIRLALAHAIELRGTRGTHVIFLRASRSRRGIFRVMMRRRACCSARSEKEMIFGGASAASAASHAVGRLARAATAGARSGATRKPDAHATSASRAAIRTAMAETLSESRCKSYFLLLSS